MENLCTFIEWVQSCSFEDLENVEILIEKVGNIGLTYEDRMSPNDPTKNLYGDDVKYMLQNSDRKFGMWQTPNQLANYMLHIKEKGIKRYLDIGTWTGTTITTVSAFLKRYNPDLEVHTFDVNQFCSQDTQDIWIKYNLPITYILSDTSKLFENYDLVFIDGDHETGIFTDFETYKNRSSLLVFHDINDTFCPNVVRCWKELKETYSEIATFTEFTDHPNKFTLMGIGVMEWKK